MNSCTQKCLAPLRRTSSPHRSLNPQHTYNNPVKYIDPSGHYLEQACGFGGGDCPIYKPAIVSREEWGAHAPGTFGNQTPSAPKYEGHFNEKEDGYKPYEGNLDDIYYRITLHHEGDDETHNVLLVQEGKMNEGFYDIGYHFIIGRDGTIYQGRDIGVRGNHAYPNTGNLGILWLGDFNPGYDASDPRYGEVDPNDDPGPTTKQYNATVDLIAWLDQEYGIDELYGHRNVPGGFSTTCPGDNAMSYIEQLKLIIQ